MSTHNIHFNKEIRKIVDGYPLLSGAMALVSLNAQTELGLPIHLWISARVYPDFGSFSPKQLCSCLPNVRGKSL